MKNRDKWAETVVGGRTGGVTHGGGKEHVQPRSLLSRVKSAGYDRRLTISTMDIRKAEIKNSS